MPRVDQIQVGFAEGDAISAEALILQRILRGWGLASDVFADPRFVSPLSRDVCRPLSDYAAAPGDVVLHHYSIASPAVEVFLRSPARKILVYHNITPERFYRGYDDGVADRLREARAVMPALVARADALWAVSAYDAEELRALTPAAVRVFPLLFDPASLDRAPDANVRKKFPVPMTNILFVGRMAPNKRIEDLIRAFAWYYWTLNRNSRLMIVGSERSAPRYYLMLRMLALEYNVPNVCFERYASTHGLPGYYRLADLFVTASDHEGYCLPVVEAMHRGVPVVARRTGGIPEAMGQGGVLYEDATPRELAVLMHRAISDVALRKEILASQDRRMAELRARRPEEELKALLADFL